jgi:hypothetical protein
MKIRNGFVSNSSSSSFICDYCGNNQSGWDLCLSDAEMHYCNNGHYVCDSHLKTDLDFRRKLVENRLENAKKSTYNRDETVALLSEGLALEDDEFEEWFDKNDLETEYDVRCELPESVCPICAFEKTSDCDLINYALKTLDKKREEIEKDMREQFSSYAKFKEWLSKN